MSLAAARSLLASLALMGFLPGQAGATTPAEYVDQSFDMLLEDMGLSPTSPEFCSIAPGLCEAMCERFVEEGALSGDCVQYCADAIEECPGQ